MGNSYVMILSKLRVKWNRVERMSDDSTLRTCGLWNFYRTNKAEFDKFAGVIYTKQCTALRQTSQKSGIGTVNTPTLAECQVWSAKLLPSFLNSGKFKSAHLLAEPNCYTVLAHFLVKNSWNALVSQNPCI